VLLFIFNKTIKKLLCDNIHLLFIEKRNVKKKTENVTIVCQNKVQKYKKNKDFFFFISSEAGVVWIRRLNTEADMSTVIFFFFIYVYIYIYISN